jgi:hypothetical protein
MCILFFLDTSKRTHIFIKCHYFLYSFFRKCLFFPDSLLVQLKCFVPYCLGFIHHIVMRYVTIDRFWIGNQIYWTLIQLVTTLHKSLSHSNSVTVFTALLGNIFQQWTFLCSRANIHTGHLTPTSYSPNCHINLVIVIRVRVKVMLQLTVSWRVCLRPDLYYWQTVAGFWCGALSLMRGRVYRLPESQSAVISLLSVCTIHILHVIKCIYIQHIQGLCQSRLSTTVHALSLVAPATVSV